MFSVQELLEQNVPGGFLRKPAEWTPRICKAEAYFIHITYIFVFFNHRIIILSHIRKFFLILAWRNSNYNLNIKKCQWFCKETCMKYLLGILLKNNRFLHRICVQAITNYNYLSGNNPSFRKNHHVVVL